MTAFIRPIDYESCNSIQRYARWLATVPGAGILPDMPAPQSAPAPCVVPVHHPRAAQNRRNQEALIASGIPFTITNAGEACEFREAGKPKVDFFPSRGTWCISGRRHKYQGGAEAFLVWYGKLKGGRK